MITTRTEPPLRFCSLDAGPRNPLGLEAVHALSEALRPDDDAPVVVLAGRSDGFSVGLDNAVLGGRREDAEALLSAMGRLLAQIVSTGVRLVAVCEGHAVAAGAMLLLVADVRIGTPGTYKIGFTEPSIGMPLPELPARLARERLDRRRLHEVTALGRVLSPPEARDVGFLDELIDPADLGDVVEARAREIAKLDPGVYAQSNRAAHRDLIDYLERAAPR